MKRLIAIDNITGIMEIADVDGVQIEDVTKFSMDSIITWISGFSCGKTAIWEVTEDQFDRIDQRYGITKI